jgi:hypothetical protein
MFGWTENRERGFGTTCVRGHNEVSPTLREADLVQPLDELLMMELHVCNRGGTLLRAFALGESPEVIVGRDERCDIRIGSPSVSREHCTIEADGEDLVLRDLGSTSGTFCNGQRIDKIRLRDGLSVEIGPAVLKFFETGI